MVNKTLEKVDERFTESMKLLKFASISIGSLPIGVHYKSIKTNHVNNSVLLITFLLIFLVIVIWLEIFNTPHNRITEVTRAIDLFTESFSSIMGLAAMMTKAKHYEQFWNLVVEADTIFLSQGIKIDYIKTKSHSKIVFICFFIYHITFFTTDFYLLTQSSNHTFVTSSFLALAIHTMHNSCNLTIACFFIYTIQKRFYLLNTVMKNLQHVDSSKLMRVLPLNKPFSHMIELTMRQNVANIKSAYNKYVAVCEISNGLRRFHLWIQVSSNIGIITANLYAVISTLMDQEYDFYIVLHCLIWVIYKVHNLLWPIFIFTRTANEVSSIHFSLSL